MTQMNICMKQKDTHRYRESTYGFKAERTGGEME